jgi:CDP-diacylglycerol---glycerol-3-phosphate 3-phosphatidyltransferase
MAEKERYETLTDFMRRRTFRLTSFLGTRLAGWGVHPDLLTFLGMVVVAAAAVLIARGEFFWGAVVIIVGAPLDALDGAVARAMQRADRFGALWDSTLDRYADAFIFTGIAYYYSTQNNQTLMLLAILAMIGTQLVSYVRARAEGLNLSCKVGLLTRMERMVIILAMLITGFVHLGLWMLVIGTHVTVAQRIWHVYRSLKQTERRGAA